MYAVLDFPVRPPPLRAALELHPTGSLFVVAVEVSQARRIGRRDSDLTLPTLS